MKITQRAPVPGADDGDPDGAVSVESDTFGPRVRALAELQGALLTTEELFQLGARYTGSRGKEQWDVREYVGRAGGGTREYRVVRGTGVHEVYRSGERVRAAAVGTALNEIEAQDRARDLLGPVR